MACREALLDVAMTDQKRPRKDFRDKLLIGSCPKITSRKVLSNINPAVQCDPRHIRQ